MDQVRTIIRAIWQQRFWVLSVLGVLVAVVCWYLAAGDLQSRFTTRKGAITQTFRSLQTLSNEAFHPNDEVLRGDLQQVIEQRNRVLQVWENLYQRQRNEVLKWPKEVIDKQFADKIERGEVKFLDPISSGMQDKYLNYIENRFDSLLEIVKARNNTQSGSNFQGEGRYLNEFQEGRGPQTTTEEENEDYLVEWADQDSLKRLLTFNSKPTSEEIWVTQEDLWVYETLLHVIANTNQLRGATRPDNTAVREITALKVGRPAMPSGQSMGKIYMPQLGAASGRAFGAEGLGGMAVEGFGNEYIGGVESAMGAPATRRRGGTGGEGVLDSRYLDANGQPIPASSKNFGTEYRQLPVRMVLKMDQRWLPPLLVECANATLPVKVDQLRINPQLAGLGATGRSTGKEGGLLDTSLSTVEIQGVVYIYMPPNPDLLNVPGAEEQQLTAATAATL